MKTPKSLSNVLFGLLMILTLPASGNPDEHGHTDSHHDRAQHQPSHEHDHNDDHNQDRHSEAQVHIDSHAARDAGIRVAEAGPKRIRQQITLTGRLRINPNKRAPVGARFAGMVRSVNAELGQPVKQGDVLAVIEANDSLKSYSLVAPRDGIVVERAIHPGALTGDVPLFVIADLSELWAEFHVFPLDLDSVQVGQPVQAYLLDQDERIASAIERLHPLADPVSQTSLVIAPVVNPPRRWKPGLAVFGLVTTGEVEAEVAVHAEAVQRMEGQSVVFVQKGGSFEVRAVSLGAGDGEYLEVLSGLGAGERYVSHGSFIVKAEIGKQSAGHDHH